MRKIISLVITLVCALCIVGCGSSKEEKQAATGDRVKDAIIKVCKDTLSTDFVSVEINDNLSGEPDSKGTKVVLVTGKIRDGSSNEKIRTANVIRAQELFGALYTSGQPISKVVYFVEADELVDGNGKKSKDNAFKFTLNKKTADKFDWKNRYSISIETFPSLIDETWMLPQFRK